MRVYSLDCFPDPDSDPSVVMIVAAESETDAVRLAFEHPNAENYAAIGLNAKRKPRKARGLAAGIHGFVNWQAFQAL